MGGFVKLDRKYTDSDIYKMPPLYWRVFERLFSEANHNDAEIPYKPKGSNIVGKKLIKRGERLTSIRQISEWVGWYERGIWKQPNPKTIKTVLDYLIQNNMLFIYAYEGNRTETHFEILNYDTYQSKEQTKVTLRKQSLPTNKNEKNIINELTFLLIESVKTTTSVYSMIGKYKNELGEDKLRKILVDLLNRDKRFDNENNLAAYLNTCTRQNGHSRKLTDGILELTGESPGWL